MLVSSLKRVRAVGRWRSLVRSLVSAAAAAAAGSGAAVPNQNLLFREMPFASQM